MNPFLVNTPVEVLELTEEFTHTIHKESSGYITKSTSINSRLIDKDGSVKVYKTANVRALVLSLSYPGLRLFNYILLYSQNKRDTISLNNTTVKRVLDISTATYQRALKELIEKCFINKKGKNEYWINPHFFFSGDRINALGKMYKEAAYTVKAKLKG